MAKTIPDTLSIYSLTLAPRDRCSVSDAGPWVWAGDALDLEHAHMRAAAAYAETIAEEIGTNDLTPAKARAQTLILSYTEGANIWAAPVMLDAINAMLDAWGRCNLTESADRLRAAREEARGTPLSLDEAQEAFEDEPGRITAQALRIVATQYVEDDMIGEAQWQSHIDATDSYVDDGTNGQDRENYTDDQDRDSYTTES